MPTCGDRAVETAKDLVREVLEELTSGRAHELYNVTEAEPNIQND
jgi:hypothetical protein